MRRTFARFITPLLLMVFIFSCGKKGPPVLKDLPEKNNSNNTYNSRHQQFSVYFEKTATLCFGQNVYYYNH